MVTTTTSNKIWNGIERRWRKWEKKKWKNIRVRECERRKGRKKEKNVFLMCIKAACQSISSSFLMIFDIYKTYTFSDCRISFSSPIPFWTSLTLLLRHSCWIRFVFQQTFPYSLSLYLFIYFFFIFFSIHFYIFFLYNLFSFVNWKINKFQWIFPLSLCEICLYWFSHFYLFFCCCFSFIFDEKKNRWSISLSSYSFLPHHFHNFFSIFVVVAIILINVLYWDVEMNKNFEDVLVWVELSDNGKKANTVIRSIPSIIVDGKSIEKMFFVFVHSDFFSLPLIFSSEVYPNVLAIALWCFRLFFYMRTLFTCWGFRKKIHKNLMKLYFSFYFLSFRKKKWSEVCRKKSIGIGAQKEALQKYIEYICILTMTFFIELIKCKDSKLCVHVKGKHLFNICFWLCFQYWVGSI